MPITPDSNLDMPSGGAGWYPSPPTPISGVYWARIVPNIDYVFHYAPYFDHWRGFRSIVPHGYPAPSWAGSTDITGPLDAHTVGYFDDTGVDETGNDNYYWCVAYDATESRAGACLQSTVLIGYAAVGDGPYTFDGVTNQGVYVNGSPGALPPWFGTIGPAGGGWFWGPIGGAPNTYVNIIGGTTWIQVTTQGAVVNNPPANSSANPGPGMVEGYAVSGFVPQSPAHTWSGYGITNGFDQDYLPAPTVQHTDDSKPLPSNGDYRGANFPPGSAPFYPPPWEYWWMVWSGQRGQAQGSFTASFVWNIELNTPGEVFDGFTYNLPAGGYSSGGNGGGGGGPGPGPPNPGRRKALLRVPMHGIATARPPAPPRKPSPPPTPTPTPPQAPAWVTALKTPHGDLPTYALDFANGRYWAKGALSTLSAIVLNDPNWGTWDPSAVVAGLGVADDNINSSNQGTILVGSTFAAGFTALLNLVTNGSPPIDDPTNTADTVWNIDFSDIATSYTTEMGISAEPSFVSGTYPTDGAYAYSDAPGSLGQFAHSNQDITTTTARVAGTVRVGGIAALSCEATAVTSSSPTNFPQGAHAPTNVSWYTRSYGVQSVYMALLAIYPIQPDADLPAICLL